MTETQHVSGGEHGRFARGTSVAHESSESERTEEARLTHVLAAASRSPSSRNGGAVGGGRKSSMGSWTPTDETPIHVGSFYFRHEIGVSPAIWRRPELVPPSFAFDRPATLYPFRAFRLPSGQDILLGGAPQLMYVSHRPSVT